MEKTQQSVTKQRAEARVAVITRTKDRPEFLQRAMVSVLQQTFSDWVHVIVNDGGQRQPVELLVSSYAHAYAGRVIVVHHEQPQGMQNASNAGLAACASEFAVIHDDDDSWERDFLRSTVRFLDRQGLDSNVRGVAVQTTQVLEEITLNGAIVEQRRLPYMPFAFVNVGELRTRNLFPPIAFLYRRDVHERIGLFRQEFDVLGDHDFNLRFARHFEIGVIERFLARYHWRHGSEGNSVTAGREIHREMLCRMKNAYYREFADNPREAVGLIDDITMPPPYTRDMGPFRLRSEDSSEAAPMPDFAARFSFSMLSLDVFDTVLKRRCHHPLDVFRILEQRAVSELQLPSQPYALARRRAEDGLRQRTGKELTFAEIYQEMQRLCGLTDAQTADLQELELQIEESLLYADPRWLELYQQRRESGLPVIFVSDMYFSGPTIAGFLANCGFVGAKVYASSDYGVTKHTGELFDRLAGELNVTGGQILHVGDNFNSDYMRAVQAGWQAFHWSADFQYTPWYAEVAPHYFEPGDSLSPLIMGQVRRRGELQPWKTDELLEKLGYEVAGPLYLSYLKWVVDQAVKDGVRKLILLGRDGYYWDKTLQLIAQNELVPVEFSYLHASRKVIQFASFSSLDADALEFLLTPNPALRVCDFINRTGLVAEDYRQAMLAVGFDDPELQLTVEQGGEFLQSCYPQQLTRLFQIIEADLQKLFARDRAGLLQQLATAGFSVSDSAFVDIGWRASSVKPMHRIVPMRPGERIKGYYFGTWREAMPCNEPVSIASYFLHFGKSAEHDALIKESVNWIETLHAAPFPTLVGLSVVSGELVPEFSASSRGGFSAEQQSLIWQGAQAFITDMGTFAQLPSGERGGFAYLFLVLQRMVCEPSRCEVATWGSLEHSDGFGLEVYKPLVMPVAADASAADLMRAYRGSSWRRGFLTAITAQQRQFVLERIQASKPKTFEQLVADLDHKTRQNDELWAENARLKFEAQTLDGRLEEQKQLIQRLQQSEDKLKGDFDWKSKQTDEFWAQNARLKYELEAAAKKFDAMRDELSVQLQETQRQRDELSARLQETQRQRDELSARLQETQRQRDELSAQLQETQRQRDELSAQLQETQRQRDELSAQLQETQQQREALEQKLSDLSGQYSAAQEVLNSRIALLKRLFSMEKR